MKTTGEKALENKGSSHIVLKEGEDGSRRLREDQSQEEGQHRANRKV